MKTLILLAFVIIANIFAGNTQELACGDKSLSYCINHYDKECEAKNYYACYRLGGLYQYEQKQYSKAKKYYEMVCDKANSKYSYVAGTIRGIWLEWEATSFMGYSCRSLGTLYYDGKGVRQSYEKAFQYNKKACDLGEYFGCADVGSAYYKGEGVKNDLNLAIKFYAKSCDLEYSVGCYFLGSMYNNGEGVKQNIPKAKELFGKACDLGYQKGCDEYKELKEKGY